jgi:hypothetical protein
MSYIEKKNYIYIDLLPLLAKFQDELHRKNIYISMQ